MYTALLDTLQHLTVCQIRITLQIVIGHQTTSGSNFRLIIVEGDLIACAMVGYHEYVVMSRSRLHTIFNEVSDRIGLIELRISLLRTVEHIIGQQQRLCTFFCRFIQQLGIEFIAIEFPRFTAKSIIL